MNGSADRLGELELVIVTGKGGVGKSTVAAAVARALERSGRTTWLLETDPRETLYHLLDVEPSGGDPVRVSRRLVLQNLDPRRVMDDLVRERVKIGPLARRVLASPVYRAFAEGAPGLEQTAVLARAARLCRGHDHGRLPRPDTVVLDAPASGHGISLLLAPRLLSDVIPSGPVGHLARDVAEMIADERRSGTVTVTTAEEMAVSEVLELIDGLRHRIGRRPEMAVVNQLYPPAPEGNTDPRLTLWRRRREENERQLERFYGAWTGLTVELPFLPAAPGPKLVDTLARSLEVS